MTAYATLLTRGAAVSSNYLVVIEPRKKVTGFTLFSGSVYSVAFSLTHFGEVRLVEQDGVALTAGSSSSLSAGQFYHDLNASVLYVRMSDSSNPSTKFVTAQFEVYLGTLDVPTYRVPTDSSTRLVYFEPLVEKSPSRKDTIKDLLFGFAPDQRDSLNLLNGSARFERLLFDCSFSMAPITAYHWLGDARTENNAASRKRILSGFCKDVTYSESGGKVAIQVFDDRNQFTSEFRNEGVTSYLGSGTFPNLDPQLEGRALRRVYGVVDGCKPYNIDFNQDAPTSSNNRIYLVAAGDSNLGTQTQTVAASPASTATRTYLNSVVGLRMDDTFQNGGTTESARITAVGANYVDHTTVVIPASAGQTITRAAVGAIDIYQNNVKYRALYGRDYSLTTFGAQDAFGFTFVSGLKTNLSLPLELSPTDEISCRIYGQKNDVTLGGPAYGGNDTETGNLATGAVILLDLLKRYAGIPESEINVASFTTLLANQTHALAVSIPENKLAKFPPLKNVITDVLKSLLAKLYQNKDGLWEVALTGPMPSAAFTTDQTKIIDNSFEYSFNFSEKVFSRVELKYARREVNSNPGVSEEEVSIAVATSDIARYLHKVEKTYEFESLHFKDSEAQVLANRLAYAFGDRRGEISFSMSEKQYFQLALGDRIDVSKKRLPSPNYDGSTVLTQGVMVEETTQSLQSIKISGTDQKGIQDASGSW